MSISTQFPPVFNKLSSIYDERLQQDQHKRYALIATAFEKEFPGRTPQFYARSPGRVNLLGEHIDYAGYSVLPMAIDRDIVIAVDTEPNENGVATIRLANTDDDYPSRSFKHSVSKSVEIDSSVLEWSNYFKCGYRAAVENGNIKDSVSIYAMVSGAVPGGAGVSSSSAFVCSSALATLTANNKTMSKGELTQTAIRGEHFAGVQTGGMDQSISVMGLDGCALLIDFFPTLAASPIAFPALSTPPVFVIANTLVRADKHSTAPTNYNLRVVETRLSAALLGKKLGLDVPNEIITLRQVHDLYFKQKGVKDSETEQLADMLSLTDQHFKKSAYSLVEIANELDMTIDAMTTKYIGSITIRAEDFKLYQRTKHVFSEARRVYEFRDLFNVSDASDGVLQRLGDLMNGSQDSCRDLFNCSCPEIDDLTSICREAGAFGSRLTGAGWGGCTVSLITESNISSFIEKVKEAYYFKRWPEWKGDPKMQHKLNDVIFASKPSLGSAVLSGISF